MLLFIGGLLSILGAIWAGINNEKQSEEIKKLTQENKELANKTVNLITGGDSYAYYDIGVRHADGINKNIGLRLNLVGKFALADVTIKIMRLIESKNANQSNKSYHLELISDNHYPLITHDLLHSTAGLTLLDLSKLHNKYIQIIIASRNGEINQQIQFSLKKNGYYTMATKVVKYTHKENGSFDVTPLFDKKDDDFPEPVKWFF
jgi:hypothetical protein